MFKEFVFFFSFIQKIKQGLRLKKVHEFPNFNCNIIRDYMRLTEFSLSLNYEICGCRR